MFNKESIPRTAVGKPWTKQPGRQTTKSMRQKRAKETDLLQEELLLLKMPVLLVVVDVVAAVVDVVDVSWADQNKIQDPFIFFDIFILNVSVVRIDAIYFIFNF